MRQDQDIEALRLLRNALLFARQMKQEGEHRQIPRGSSGDCPRSWSAMAMRLKRKRSVKPLKRPRKSYWIPVSMNKVLESGKSMIV